MRVPGFRPNYHNTAANRDVNWSTHNNPVNNCSVLFQLSSLELQIKNMTGGRLLRGATVPRSGLTDIRPATTRNLVELPDIKAITGSNAIRLAAHRFMDPNFKTPEALNIDPMIFSAFLLHPRATLELATPPPGPNERGLRRVS